MKRNWFRSLFSRFAVETVHYCDCFSEVWSESHRCISAWFVQWYIPVFLISLILLRGWAAREVFLCQLIHIDALLLGPANLKVANHDFLDLEENDREFLRNALPGRQLFCDTHAKRYGTVSVLQLYRAEHHGVAPSWWRSPGWREHPVAID